MQYNDFPNIESLKNQFIDYPPYSIEEITDFETKFNIKFPEIFRKYMTEISSYTYRTHLGFQKIELSDDNIVKLRRDIMYDIIYNPEDYTEEQNKQIKFTEAYTFRDIGCGYTHIIILEQNPQNYELGTSVGSISVDYSAGDGAVLTLCNTFTDYLDDEELNDRRLVTTKQKLKSEQKEKQEEKPDTRTESQKIVDYAFTYNFLRILSNQGGLSYSN
jgi:hypothetical protein